MMHMSLDVEAFLSEHVPPTPAHDHERKVLHAAFDAKQIDLDTLILIITMSWRCYSDAPRLAAVAWSWKEAAKEAEKMVRGEDVPVPRLCITLPLLPPLEPILSTAERAVRVSWGAAFEAYSPFAVEMPAAGFHVRCEYELEDIKSTVRSGRYLNSVTINMFLTSLMPDMTQATVARMCGKRVSNFFIPSGFSASIIDSGAFHGAEDYVKKAFDHADHMHMTMHFKETCTHAEHWVHVRVTKAVHKVEIFEPASLVQTNIIGQQMLHALVASGAVTSAEGWTVVLYNKQRHRMPRQSDGSSCGVFACVVALHLVEVRRMPRNIQEEIAQWREYVAMKVWGSRVIAS